MLNALDLLIVVVMVLAAASLLALCLMFLIKNKTVKRICFFGVSLLAVYLGYVGFRIHFPGFLPRMILAVVIALTAIGAVVLEHLSKDSLARNRLAHILSAGTLVAGMLNAFL